VVSVRKPVEPQTSTFVVVVSDFVPNTTNKLVQK
jgi:hypothetical protein